MSEFTMNEINPWETKYIIDEKRLMESDISRLFIFKHSNIKFYGETKID